MGKLSREYDSKHAIFGNFVGSSGISCCRGAVVLCLESCHNPEHFIKTMPSDMSWGFFGGHKGLAKKRVKGDIPHRDHCLFWIALYVLYWQPHSYYSQRLDVWCVSMWWSPWFVFVSRAENATFKSIPFFSVDINSCCGINGRLFS